MSEAGEQPGNETDEDRKQEGAVAERRQGERHDDARQRGHRLNREVDAAEHDDEADAARENEQGGSVAGELEESLDPEEGRLKHPDEEHEREQRHDWQPAAELVAVE